MATVSPALTQHDNAVEILWEACATGDTIVPANLRDVAAILGCVHAYGTWGSATVTLQGSNDENAAFLDLPDTAGAAISLIANGLKDFSTGCMFIKPAFSGGTGDDVDVRLVLRK